MFRNPFDNDNVTITKKVKEWTTSHFTLSINDIVLVSEVNCVEPNCPDYETEIIIVKSQGTRHYYKIRKPLTYLRKWDIDSLIR